MSFRNKRTADKSLEDAADPIHVFVATPAYDGRVYTDYAMSLAESARDATLFGIRITASVMGNGAFIDLARNAFVRLFLETQCTHLFFIDADLRWESRAFVGLLQSGLPICAGIYPKRQDPEEYPCRMIEQTPGAGIWVNSSGYIMCDRVASGFLCISRAVAQRMYDEATHIKLAHGNERRVFYTDLNEHNEFIGEDYAFCTDYLRKYNEPIPVYPDFNFTHASRWKGNWHNFLNRQLDESKALIAKAHEEGKECVAELDSSGKLRGVSWIDIAKANDMTREAA